jgi:ribonuclease T1
MKRFLALSTIVLLFTFLFLPAQVQAESCGKVAAAFNERLSPKIDEAELADILNRLNATGNRQLPDKFMTKAQARSRGWKPGRDLWSVNSLKGFSIGGDKFGNFEGRLPRNKWREADLDYTGGRRGAKRLVFSSNGKRFVTVDHYQNFTEVPACR